MCKFEGCEREAKSKGYCTAHYNQLQRGIELKPLRPMRGLLKDEYPKIFERIDREATLKANPDLDIDKITCKQNLTIYLKCDKHKEPYPKLVLNATKEDHAGCGICSGFIVVPKFNSLWKKNPKVAQEWSRENEMKSSQVYWGSNFRAKWVCKEGHTWEAKVNHRSGAIHSNGCPYCTSKKVMPGFNDFATAKPELVNEWNYEKNQTVPEDYTPQSNVMVWWKCGKGHEWKARIQNRTRGFGMCRICHEKNYVKINN